ncbi:DNA-binding protein [Prevotella sp. oral taxon 376]|uniref:DNA-binding protein n=1 Tax=Prevotella sp. oral taxon 376 TaxID=712466 RepID=UPI000D1D8A3B|nr:DNA-binding protein [Prevotella sp. oral taxon 376]PTL33328.1 DNA-binding protein [Prevotella sp. oral taxon 376]
MAKKETKNKSFILRIDSETMDAIEKWASDEFRSTNGQLQWIISEALRKNRRLPKQRKEKPTEKETPTTDEPTGNGRIQSL